MTVRFRRHFVVDLNAYAYIFLLLKPPKTTANNNKLSWKRGNNNRPCRPNKPNPCIFVNCNNKKIEMRKKANQKLVTETTKKKKNIQNPAFGPMPRYTFRCKLVILQIDRFSSAIVNFRYCWCRISRYPFLSFWILLTWVESINWREPISTEPFRVKIDWTWHSLLVCICVLCAQ